MPKQGRVPRAASKAALVSRRDARLARAREMMALRDTPGPEDIEARAERLIREAQASGDEVSTRLAAYRRALDRWQEKKIKTGDVV
eukprot:234183-Lingulodinium_polyedra.AAC.1